MGINDLANTSILTHSILQYAFIILPP